MVPDNVVLAAVNMNILGIITFSLFFGICLASLGDQADGFISLITVCIPRRDKTPEAELPLQLLEQLSDTDRKMHVTCDYELYSALWLYQCKDTWFPVKLAWHTLTLS